MLATHNDLVTRVLRKLLTSAEQDVDNDVVNGSGVPVTVSSGSVNTEVTYGNSVFSGIGSATANNTTGGNRFAVILAAELPAGLYQIDVYTQIPTFTNPSTSNLIEIRIDSTVMTRLISHIVSQNSGAYQPKTCFTFYRRLTGSNDIGLHFAVNCAATETQACIGQITATKIAD